MLYVAVPCNILLRQIGNKIDLLGSKQMMSEEMEAGDYQEISTCANRWGVAVQQALSDRHGCRSSGTQDYESLVLRIDSFIDKYGSSLPHHPPDVTGVQGS